VPRDPERLRLPGRAHRPESRSSSTRL
jgi:hypothetical protein